VPGVPEAGYSVEFFDVTGNTVAVTTLPASAWRLPAPTDRPPLCELSGPKWSECPRRFPRKPLTIPPTAAESDLRQERPPDYNTAATAALDEAAGA
jgi:hypothetical protein